MTYYRAWENQRFVRGMLREKQPELAAALDAAVREPSCLRCDGSRCSPADELTLPRTSQLKRHLAPAGHTGGAGRAARLARPARGRPREFSERGALPNLVGRTPRSLNRAWC
jgi:hypothetical protein